ncbi:hypothetical protein AB0K60_30310 [Thermopolyspora sp. NPDC052614]|uniref:hypothetical protein n=1 Tax=Thermopolyspora sp. NPDC052614 TaxID=3155682 RepID=UPI003443B343
MTRSTAAGWTGALLAVLLLTGCSSDQLADRGGQEDAPPDKISDVDYIEVFRNADNFPNVARICIEGLAFASTSSGRRGEDAVAAPALLRIPEWDAKCREFTGNAPTPSPTPSR